MVWLTPRNVSFAGTPLPRVLSIVANRVAETPLIEYDQAGPHPRFVDAPRQRTTIVVQRSIAHDEPLALKPSMEAILRFESAGSLSEAGARQISATVVITAIEHALTARRGMVQTITAVAVSPDGAADPLTDAPASTPGGAA